MRAAMSPRDGVEMGQHSSVSHFVRRPSRDIDRTAEASMSHRSNHNPTGRPDDDDDDDQPADPLDDDDGDDDDGEEDARLQVS
jgi:hypothetical protein